MKRTTRSLCAFSIALLWPALAVAAVPLSDIAAVEAGGHFTCAITGPGAVKCWGYNHTGQLGDGSGFDRPAAGKVLGISGGVVDVGLGYGHACALGANGASGAMKCWGDNTAGELGDGTFTSHYLAANVPGLQSGVATMAAGAGHTCAVTSAGGLKCWGRNEYGQLGDGTTTDRAVPTDVVGLASGVAAVAPAGTRTCALTTAGGVKCWGGNGVGELGDGTTFERHTPVDVNGLSSGVAQLAHGGYKHMCVLTMNGGVKCWGYNNHGQLGDGTTPITPRLAPGDVPGLTGGVAQISLGNAHTCARMTTGGVKCWGDNLWGQAGTSGPFTIPSPSDVSGLGTGVASLAVGSEHSCATKTDGSVSCWGHNNVGQLGRGNIGPETQLATPAPVVEALAPSLANISTRMQVLTGDEVMIGGFVIGGSANKTVAIVATGPSLGAFGIANPLTNPTLTLVRSSDQTVVATNDDWQTAANAAQLQAAGLAPPDARESAILINLPPGAYTAIVSGVGGTTGVGLVAVYEVDRLEVPIVNLSTRGRVLTGNDRMIGGFVIQGLGPQVVAIVATGPSLRAFGVTDPLNNPTLTLVRSSDQAVIASNGDWQTAANAAQLQAFGFAPSNPAESAILITLNPGAYTAIVEGVGGSTGVGVVGVYIVP